MPTALLYQDFIHNNYAVYRALRETFGAQNTDFCTAEDIRKGRLRAHDIDLFVLPGGADLYYVEKLEAAGNEGIKHYVNSGGRYLGICAGAYYAARSILYAKGSAYEVKGPRALGFFPGLAVGPVGAPRPFDPDGFTSPRIGTLRDRDSNILWKSIYWGGPAFAPLTAADTSDIVDILARYEDPEAQNSPAIIRCKVGEGRAVLCGVHPEITPSDLENMGYARDRTNHPFARAAAQLRHFNEHSEPSHPRALWSRVMEWTMSPQ